MKVGFGGYGAERGDEVGATSNRAGDPLAFMPKTASNEPPTPRNVERAQPAKLRPRPYPSDQGEYAIEKPEERADPTTAKKRA